MVKYCYVCKINDQQPGSQHLSFHRLPTDVERRRIWLSLLGFDEDHQFPKRVDICSHHFQPEDFQFRSDGSRHLKQNALPLCRHSAFDRRESTSSESVVESPSKQPQQSLMSSTETETENSAEIDILSSSEESPVKKRIKMDVEILPVPESSNTNTLDETVTVEPNLSAVSVESSSTTLTASETEMGMKTPEKKKRKFYVGDMSSGDFDTPKKAKKNFQILKKTITSQRKKIHSLQTTVISLRKRIKSLNSLTKFLKEKTYISDNSESVIKASLTGSAVDIFERMLKGPSTQKYNPTLRSFALTLAFYSPRAYNFVRNTFNKSLPHLSTISKWNSSVDGSPGFTEEALNVLKIKQTEAKSQGKTILCNLVMDEMSIRQQVEWTGTKFSGYVDISTKIDSDILPEAKEVLVFMLVCLNGSWKLPIGYFFLDGLVGFERAELVRKCLTFINDSGVTVTSLTFDGAPVNFTMASCLGANFSSLDNIKSHFTHPVTTDKVFIFLDPCHMIKLVRNTFGSQKYLIDGNNEQVDWNFLTKLVDKQYFEGIHLGTKIRLRHLQWVREKMKVKIATQTLSKSVADALLYLGSDLKLPEFENVRATANFVKKFNDLFDVFNSRNRLAKYFFKKPLSAATADTFFDFFNEMTSYIKELRLGNIQIIQSARRTGFIGFLICINSLKDLYNTYVLEKKSLKYILANKLSQDHLELFFGAIRSKGGFNNNPTARQFEAAYKRLLVHTQITGPDTGNVTCENLTILSCGSGQRITVDENGSDLLETSSYLVFEQSTTQNIMSYQFATSRAWDLTVYAEDVVGYISGFIVKCLNRCVTCTKCLNLLEGETVTSRLQQRKQYGNLSKASEPVVKICRAAEKYFRFFEKTTDIFNKNNKYLLSVLTKNTFDTLPVDILNYFDQHLFDDDPIDGHVVSLIKLILNKYFNLRIHHETANKLDFSRKDRIRSVYTKTILFRHQ